VVTFIALVIATQVTFITSLQFVGGKKGGGGVSKKLNLGYLGEISKTWLGFIDTNKHWIFLELDYIISHLNVQAPFVQNKGDIL